jgi:hypothetical protein
MGKMKVRHAIVVCEEAERACHRQAAGGPHLQHEGR